MSSSIIPPSQKAPSGSSGDKPKADPNAPKVTSTGAVKDPQSGSTLSASAKDPTAKEGKENNPSNQPTISPKTSAAAAAVAAAPKDTRPLDKNFSEVSGEILQGDSYRLTLKRGDVTFHIPVSMETTRDLYTLDNTFKIVSEILKAANRDELHEKFESFIAQ
jgi:hypothetical protein